MRKRTFSTFVIIVQHSRNIQKQRLFFTNYTKTLKQLNCVVSICIIVLYQENEVTTPSSAKEEIKETPKEEVDLTEDDKQTISYLMETTLSATFGSENCEVYYDEEHGWFQVNVIYDGAAVMVVGVQQDSSLRGQWETDVLDSMVALNLSMKDLLVTLGHDDVSVVLTLLNDLNTDNVLVGVKDGVVMFDATEQ